MKKLMSILLVMIMTIIPGANAFAAENPFSDVKSGDWFADSVAWAVENNITKGTSDSTFSPDQVCTRGQIVTFLWRSAGQPAPTKTDNPFTDVKESDYFYNAVLWAVENGVTAGATAETFAPDSICTREQAVTFMHRSEGNPAPLISCNPFTDVKSGDFSYAPILWAVGNGITNGTTGSTFGPKENCTRAQIVAFLYRMKTVAPPTKFWKVQFYSDGGSLVPTQEIGDGKCAVRPVPPTRRGYRFTGWWLYRFDEEDGYTHVTVYNFDEPVTEDITLFAQWEKVDTAREYLAKWIIKNGIYDGRAWTEDVWSNGCMHALYYYPERDLISVTISWTSASGGAESDLWTHIPSDEEKTVATQFQYYTGRKGIDARGVIDPKTFTRTTTLSFSNVLWINGVKESSMQENYSNSIRAFLDTLNQEIFAGTSYTTADLGFTAYR